MMNVTTPHVDAAGDLYEVGSLMHGDDIAPEPEEITRALGLARMAFKRSVRSAAERDAAIAVSLIEKRITRRADPSVKIAAEIAPHLTWYFRAVGAVVEVKPA